MNNNVSTECFHCGYRTVSYEVACNNGSWQCVNNNTCHNVSGSVPSYSGECDGGMNNGNKCGAYKLTDVNCKLNDSFSGADLLGVYSNICQLKQGNTCFTGQIRSCDSSSTSTTTSNDRGNNSPKGGILNNNNLIQICQDDCHWSECFQEQRCPDIPNPEGSQYQACNNDDPNLCGTKTATAKCDESTDYKWIWDFSNATCQNLQPKPNPEPTTIKCGDGGALSCKYKVFNHVCQLSSSGYTWVRDEINPSCELLGNSNCSILGAQQGDKRCMGTQPYNCQWKKCPEGSYYNDHGHTCYQPVDITGDSVFYTRKRNPSKPSNCGPNGCSIEADTFKYCPSGNATGYQCRNNYTCPDMTEIQIVNKTPVEYCRTANNPTTPAFRASQTPTVKGKINQDNPQGCTGIVNYWETDFAYDIIKCQTVNPIN